jgi:predicted RNA binding protein YcfA (HicA-like mRNA interferase family)
MAEYEKKVREVLKRNGWFFHHHGKGDHDVWVNQSGAKKVTVDGKINSRHMANTVLKEAGIDYHF